MCRMRFLISVGASLIAAIFVQPLQGHHSGAMFDSDKTLELRGTIKEFQFTNPHAWIQIEVVSESGATVEWSLEWGSPNVLGRRGIRPSTFPPGEQVTVRTHPMRDGSPAGGFVGAKFEDGTIVGDWE